MTFDDLIREWRFADHAAKAIGVSRTTLYVWRYRGIPADCQPAIRKIIAERQKAAKRKAKSFSPPAPTPPPSLPTSSRTANKVRAVK